MQDGDYGFGASGTAALPNDMAGWVWIAVSIMILGAGLITAKFFKD